MNIKGQRYKIGKIIKALNEEIALKEYDKVVKKEYSGIRNITSKTIKILSNEKEYSNIIKQEVESNKEESILEEESVNINIINDNLIEQAENFDKELKTWKVVFTPGRKPRIRDLNNYVYAIGNTKEEAKAYLANKLNIDVKDIKDKYIVMTETKAKDILTKDEKFKKFVVKESNTLFKDKDEELNFIKNSINADFLHFEGFTVTYDEDNKYIKEIKLKNIPIFEMNRLKWFIVKPDNAPALKIQSLDMINVSTEYIVLLSKLDKNSIYLKSLQITVMTEDLKDKITISLRNLIKLI